MNVYYIKENPSLDMRTMEKCDECEMNGVELNPSFLFWVKPKFHLRNCINYFRYKILLRGRKVNKGY